MERGLCRLWTLQAQKEGKTPVSGGTGFIGPHLAQQEIVNGEMQYFWPGTK